MNKESLITQSKRVLQTKSITFSKWQVNKTVGIPVRKVPAAIPLWPTQGLHRMIALRPALRRFGMVIAILLGAWTCLPANATQSVSLAWNKSTDTNATGYVIFAGSASGDYTSQLDVGTNLTVTVTGLKEGKTNFFTVSAYNSAKIVGMGSGEISYIVPGLMVMTPKVRPTDPTRLNFPTAPGHWYEVSASTDLKNWATLMQTAVATTNAWLGYADTSKSFPKRFYRLIMH